MPIASTTHVDWLSTCELPLDCCLQTAREDYLPVVDHDDVKSTQGRPFRAAFPLAPAPRLKWRLGRTIVQGILGVVAANIDVLVGVAVLDPSARAIVVALSMAVLSPVMAEIGKHLPEGE